MSEKLPNNLLELIKIGETYTIEFKEASKELPKSLFESICGLSNRNGGHIFLGVKDNGTITGVDTNSIIKMKKDFANQCNNPQKINPTIYATLKEYEIEGTELLARAICHELDHLDGHLYVEKVEGELMEATYDEDEE